MKYKETIGECTTELEGTPAEIKEILDYMDGKEFVPEDSTIKNNKVQPEENIYQHKCCKCGELFQRKGKMRMSDKFLLQAIILGCKSTFTVSDIVNVAVQKEVSYSPGVLEQEIKSMMSTYLKNGTLCISEHGYQRCMY